MELKDKLIQIKNLPVSIPHSHDGVYIAKLLSLKEHEKIGEFGDLQSKHYQVRTSSPFIWEKAWRKSWHGAHDYFIRKITFKYLHVPSTFYANLRADELWPRAYQILTNCVCGWYILRRIIQFQSQLERVDVYN